LNEGGTNTTEEQSQPTAWNDAARISCEFAFKCPKVWERLVPTAVEGVRHCPACDRDVHLALTEEDFRRHADQRRCVAVRVVAAEATDEAQPVYIVGSPGASYGAHLKRV